MKQTGKRKFNLVGASCKQHDVVTAASSLPNAHDQTSTSSSSQTNTTSNIKSSSTATPMRFNFFERNILQQFLVPTLANQEVMLHCSMGKYSLIYDKYPKARIHLLIVVSDHFINAKSVKQLHREHVEHLREIQRFVQRVCSEIENGATSDISESTVVTSSSRVLDEEARKTLQCQLGTAKLKVGFHAIPSLYPLHIHILSDDMDAETMKNKKHWNSFTTNFFVELDYVMEVFDRCESRAEEKDRSCSFINLLPSDISENYTDQHLESLLKQDLRCHKCQEEFRSMPHLKAHLRSSHH
jgi:aprataxin